MNLKEFLTDEEIILAFKLRYAQPIYEKIVLPHLHRIKALLGQDTDPLQLAVQLERYIRKDVTWH